MDSAWHLEINSKIYLKLFLSESFIENAKSNNSRNFILDKCIFCILEYFWEFFNNDLLTKFFQQISLSVFLYLQGNAIGK